ncbi:MAG TPA: hypothetical protein VGO00_06180 [Kofleriaceae bacterium]|nr:hypothetical protein [Kofleriaceae bacterium]
MPRFTAIARRWISSLGGGAAFALVCTAWLMTAVMYCGNSNVDDAPDAPRGDGRYRPLVARGDGHMHFLITRSIVFDLDFDFDNDLARFGDPWNQPRTVTGKKNVMQQVGPSMIWAPVLGVAQGLAVVVNAFGGDIAMHGYTMFHQRIVFASSVVFAWLAIACGIIVARRFAGGRWGPAFAGVAVLLGTPLVYYATFMPSYAHAMDAAACSGFLAYWALTLGDSRWRRAIILGVLLGIATMVRIQDIAIGAVVALELVTVAIRSKSARPIARGAVVLAIAVVMFVPQLYVWSEMYGSWWTTPQGPGQMRYSHAMVLELLFSPRNGWFSNTPIAYLGVIGLGVGVWAGRRLHEHARFVCAAMLVAIVTQIYTNAITYEWWSGASFGQRRLCSMTLPLIVGLAALLRGMHLWLRTRLPRWSQLAIAGVVLGYLVVWNLVWVFALSHGRPAGRDHRPTCCGDVPAPLSWIASPVYRVVGNPFEFPASAIFAIEHGVGLARWDQANAVYPLVPGVLGYQDGSYRKATASWNIAGPGGEPFLLRGFGPPQHDRQRAFRWIVDDRGDFLLPILMPEPHRITVPIAANAAPGEQVDVEISYNGDSVARATIGPSWTTMVFDTDGSLGENVVTIEARAVDYRGGPPAPASGTASVAIGPMQVALP